MKEIIIQNIPTIFSLIGVIIGAILAHASNWILKTRETKLLVTKTLIDKRIEAYEKIIAIAKVLRITVSTYEKDYDSNLITYPRCLEDNESFELLFKTASTAINDSSHWLDTQTTRELGLVQDYLATLSIYVRNINQSNNADFVLKDLGIIIKQDFIDLSSSLEKVIFKSYPQNLINLKTNYSFDWHKYQKDETHRRLSKLKLIENEKLILSKINTARDEN